MQTNRQLRIPVFKSYPNSEQGENLSSIFNSVQSRRYRGGAKRLWKLKEIGAFKTESRHLESGFLGLLSPLSGHEPLSNSTLGACGHTVPLSDVRVLLDFRFNPRLERAQALSLALTKIGATPWYLALFQSTRLIS